MSPVSSLTVASWKEDKSQVTVSPTRLIGSVITDINKTRACGNLAHSLKYLDDEVKLDVNNFKMKFNRNRLIDIPVCDINESYEGFFYWKTKHIHNYKPDFTATKDVLCSIMNTQFDIDQNFRKWSILATLEDNNMVDLKPENNNIVSKPLAKQKEMLKRYLFIKKPEYLSRKIISKLDQVVYGIYELKLGINSILYIAEIPGVISEDKVVNLVEFSAADSVVCEVFDKTQLTSDIMYYNPILWSQAELTRAPLCYMGIYDSQTNSLNDIKKITADIFEDTEKYENLWCPGSAWNFLDLFFQFVKTEINNVTANNRKKCVWKFTSHIDCITCEPLLKETVNGQTTYRPLPPENYF